MKKKIFIFQATDFKFIYVLAGWKLVITAKFHPKLHQLGKTKTQGHGGMECDLNTLHKSKPKAQFNFKLPQ